MHLFLPRADYPSGHCIQCQRPSDVVGCPLCGVLFVAPDDGGFCLLVNVQEQSLRRQALKGSRSQRGGRSKHAHAHPDEGYSDDDQSASWTEFDGDVFHDAQES